MTRTIRPVVAVTSGTVVLAGLLLSEVPAARQAPTPEPAFVAFRVDADHVIATIKVMEPMARQVREGLSAEPVARFGYQYFEPPASWRDRVPAETRDAKRWVVDAAPEQAFDAKAERLVGGNAQCTEAVAVLLRIDGPRAEAFASLPARYFVASPARRETPAAGATSPVRVRLWLLTGARAPTAELGDTQPGQSPGTVPVECPRLHFRKGVGQQSELDHD